MHANKKPAHWLLLITWFGLFIPACASLPPTPQSLSVIYLSIDGLRPEFYLDSKFPAPTLQRLAREGVSAQSVVPIYPSLTFPTHATLATGVRPNRHGIYSNTRFDPEHAPSRDWNLDAKRLKSPALWDLARSHGKKVAIFGWPVSQHAQADWIVPEVFSTVTKGIDHAANWQVMLENTDPKLMKKLIEHNRIKNIQSNADYDQWLLDALLYVHTKERPDLSMIHFRSLDEVQHLNGRDSPLVSSTLQALDGWVERLVQSIDQSKTRLVIAGDHGFVDFQTKVRINQLFVKKNWIQLEGKNLKSWSVIAHAHEGQAAIYIKDPKLEPQVQAVLKKEGKSYWKILSRKYLDAMGSFPEAAFALDAAPGVSLSSSLEGEWVEKLPKRSGQHGGDASQTVQLHTGLIIVGPGIPLKKYTKSVSMLDIAPTVAHLMDLSFPSAENSPLLFK